MQYVTKVVITAVEPEVGQVKESTLTFHLTQTIWLKMVINTRYTSKAHQ